MYDFRPIIPLPGARTVFYLEPSVISTVIVYSVKRLMSIPLYIGWQRIMDGQGLDIAFTGMFVVFLALAAISFCIAMLPKVMAALGGILPEHPQPPSDQEVTHDEEAVAAAVGFVLDEENNTR